MQYADYRALQTETVIDDLKVAYVDIGSGPVMVLVHGIPVWGYLWKDVIGHLRSDFRLIIPDLLGYGYSDQRDQFDRSVVKQAGWMLQLLDHIGVSEKFHLVGHDIGGAVTQRMAVAAPDRLLSLTLADSVVLDSWPAEPMIRLGNPRSNERYQGDALARTFIERLPGGIHRKEIVTPDLLEGWMAPYMTDEGKLSLIRNAAALNTNHTMEITEELRALPIDIHLVWARHDQFQPLASAQQLQALVPGTTLHVIEESDHFLPFEQPATLAEWLKARAV